MILSRRAPELYGLDIRVEGSPLENSIEAIRTVKELRERLLQFGLMPDHADEMIERLEPKNAAIMIQVMRKGENPQQPKE